MDLESGRKNESQIIQDGQMDEENDDVIPIEPIKEYTANKLKQEAFQYRRFWDELQKSFALEENESYYLLSSKWLNRWKKYVSYEELIENKQPSRFFGGPRPHKVNEDLIDKDIAPCFKYSPLKDHAWNEYIKENLEEGKDYIIVNKQINDLFIGLYDGKRISRYSVGVASQRMVEVNLLRFQALLIYPSVVQGIANGYASSKGFDQEYLQVARSMTVSDYYALIERTVCTFRGNFQRDKNVRIWRYRNQDALKSLHQNIKKQTMDLDYNEDQVFDLNGELLSSESKQTFEELGITSNELVIIEFKESNKMWTIKNDAVQIEGKCEGCYSVRVLEYPCICKKVSYCSEKCKINDEKYHNPKCDKQASDDETVKAMVINEQSIKGICGLTNLGNTCFMNSGIQCLSNTQPLQEYFLSNTYLNEINETNPIGTKGELVRKYASLIKKLWCQNKNVVSPTALKMAVGKFQPMFKGYHQHDSSELITFMLDGLHEDLNKIKSKPYVTSPDDDGKQDFEIAKLSWEGFTQRNQSIIVDLMYGQYKSTLRCPNCNRISITFDPYLMVSLSVPSTKKKYLQYQLYTSLLKSEKKTVLFDKTNNQTVQQFLNQISQEYLNNQQCIMFICSTYQSYEYIEENKLLSDIRKRSKRVGLGVRKLDELEQSIEPNNRIYVPAQNKLIEGYGYKRSMYQSSLIIISNQWTLKQIHFNIFKNILFLFRHLIEEADPAIIVDQEYYEKEIHEKYYSLEIKSNGSFWVTCAYCGKKSCQDCPLPYTDQSFQSFFDQCKQDDNHLNFEISLMWKLSPFEKVRLSDIYDHYHKNFVMKEEKEEEKNNDNNNDNNNNNNNNYNYNNNNNNYNNNNNNQQQQQQITTLKECIQFSQQPEQLEEDNTWYCRTCQVHVQAFKSMQIYKAPKILIFHLKRFKASANRSFKTKLETLVEFPINGLDMSEFVLNSNVPEQYSVETNDINGESKDKKLIYDLYAVSNHFGGLGGGHYTAYAKNNINNTWYNFDDSQVSEVHNVDQIISKSAYILFYKIREQNQDLEQNFNTSS